jgi:hypothetical protein
MKLRHAVALAIVGWYLMVPPMYEHNDIDSSAPLSPWQIVQSCDSAARMHDRSCANERRS